MTITIEIGPNLLMVLGLFAASFAVYVFTQRNK